MAFLKGPPLPFLVTQYVTITLYFFSFTKMTLLVFRYDLTRIETDLGFFYNSKRKVLQENTNRSETFLTPFTFK